MFFAEDAGSITTLFHTCCGAIGVVTTASDTPFALVAVMLNV